ncbi:MAG: hypothetical protein PQJ50_09580 [Spirochaetales bacterium]|nr:hypothetical protein [Spirochaetales bacterium]
MKKILIILAFLIPGTGAFACAFHGGADADYLRMLFADYIIDDSCDIWEGMSEGFVEINSLVNAQEKLPLFSSENQTQDFLKNAAAAVQDLESLGYELTAEKDVPGITAVLHNGEGPVLLLVTDMDSSKESSDHDRMAWFISMAGSMGELKEFWSGTLILISRSGEDPALTPETFTAEGIPQPDYAVALYTAPIASGSAVLSPGTQRTELNKAFINHLQSVLETTGDVSHVYGDFQISEDTALLIDGFEQMARLFVGVSNTTVSAPVIASPFTVPRTEPDSTPQVDIISKGSRIAAKMALSVFHQESE